MFTFRPAVDESCPQLLQIMYCYWIVSNLLNCDVTRYYLKKVNRYAIRRHKVWITLGLKQLNYKRLQKQ